MRNDNNHVVSVEEMNEVDKWIKVIADPLGLVGFALFLVFSLLAKTRRTPQTGWLTAGFITLAAIALLGGLGLAYLRQQQLPDQSRPATQSAAPISAPQQPPVPTAGSRATPSASPHNMDEPQPSTQVQQETRGPQSPAVGGVQGDVTITIQSSPSPTSETQRPAAGR